MPEGKDVEIYVSTARIVELMTEAQFDDYKDPRCYANQEIVCIKNSDVHSIGIASLCSK